MSERTEAQKRADRAYYERNKGARRTIGASFTATEAAQILTTFAAHGLSVGDVLRIAAARLERGDKL